MNLDALRTAIAYLDGELVDVPEVDPEVLVLEAARSWQALVEKVEAGAEVWTVKHIHPTAPTDCVDRCEWEKVMG